MSFQEETICSIVRIYVLRKTRCGSSRKPRAFLDCIHLRCPAKRAGFILQSGDGATLAMGCPEGTPGRYLFDVLADQWADLDWWKFQRV